MNGSKVKILLGFTVAYLLIAGSLIIADRILTAHVLENLSNTYELNVRIDATSLSTLLGGIGWSLVLFVSLFFASLAMCMSDKKQQDSLQMWDRLDELAKPLIGAVAIWNLIMLFGAVVNNAGMILFEFSWMQSTFSLVGLTTDNEQMAAFVLVPIVSFVILVVPSYLIFWKIVVWAKRLAVTVERQPFASR